MSVQSRQIQQATAVLYYMWAWMPASAACSAFLLQISLPYLPLLPYSYAVAYVDTAWEHQDQIAREDLMLSVMFSQNLQLEGRILLRHSWARSAGWHLDLVLPLLGSQRKSCLCKLILSSSWHVIFGKMRYSSWLDPHPSVSQVFLATSDNTKLATWPNKKIRISQ